MRLKKATKKRFFSQKNRVFKKPLEYNDIYPRHADFCSVPAGFMEYLSGCRYNTRNSLPFFTSRRYFTTIGFESRSREKGHTVITPILVLSKMLFLCIFSVVFWKYFM